MFIFIRTASDGIANEWGPESWFLAAGVKPPFAEAAICNRTCLIWRSICCRKNKEMR